MLLSNPCRRVLCRLATLIGLTAALLSGCDTGDRDNTSLTSHQQTSQSDQSPSLNCHFPTKAPHPKAPTTAFAHYSWEAFVALNWPASDRRGQPDCSAALGRVGPTVWESFKTTDELFLANAKDPGPWSSGALADLELVLRAKADPSLPVESSISEAVGGWLIDQYENPTYYSISVNKTSYDYVRSHDFYNAEVVSQADSVTFPDGALEVKAAWRIMTDKDDQSRYHTIEAQVMQFDKEGEPTGNTVKKTVGLVGMHIVYKAPGFPQWVWATFEQVDNTRPSPAGHASYYNPDCAEQDCPPNQSPKKTGQPFGSPNQITRMTPVTQEVTTVNTAWQQRVKGTAFEHYRLISPQWPTDPQDPGNPQGTPTPGTVANVTMESYIQPTSSCMDCHSTARVPGDKIKSDDSFIFLFARSPKQTQPTEKQGD